MANYRKSFNFRSGVQVDNNRLIVDGRGNVGIGTSIPGRELDVYGGLRVNGLLESQNVNISGFSTFQNDVKIGSAITFGASSGIITATSFRGDGSLLSGVVAIATAGWIVSGDSLTTSRSIGIGTTNPTSKFYVDGNTFITGVVTATTFVGALTGTATTAANVIGGIASVTQLNVTGVSTFNSNVLIPSSNIGIGTTNPASALDVIGSSKFTGVSTFNNTTDSSSTSTGALIVSGGVGIAKNLFVGANLSANGVGTIGTLGVTGLTTTQNLLVTGVGTIGTLGVTGLTTTQNLLVTGVSTLGIVTSSNIYSTGIITATTFSGSLSGTASTAQSLTGTPNINVGVTTATTLNATSLFVSGTTLSALSNGYVGIGTTNPTTDLQIKKSGATSIEVISTTSTSSISIGQSVGLGNSSALLQYDSGLLKINNYGLGGFQFNLHEGTGTGSTDGFRVRYDSSNILDLTYDGKLGINVTNPDYNLQVNGTSYLNGNAQIVGILTVGTGGSKFVLDPIGGSSVLPFGSSQNFNTTSGISTFNKINVTTSVRVGAGETSTVSGDITLASKVGIGTTIFTSLDPTNSYKLIVDGSTKIRNNVMLSGQLGLSTNGEFLSDPRVIPNTAPFSSTVPYFSYGDFQVTTNGGSTFVGENFTIVPKVGVTTVGFGTTNGGLVPSNYNGNKYLTRVGINTFIARSVLDVGAASTTSNSYFIPPSLTQSELNIVSTLWNSPTRTGYDMAYRTTPNGVVPGAIVYNSTARELQVGIGSTTFGSIGKILQVVSASYSTQVNHGAIEGSTGLTTTITLSSSTNKVMVYVTQPLYIQESTAQLILKRKIGAGSFIGITTAYHGAWEVNATTILHSATSSISYLDSPGSTSTLTYETFGQGIDGTSNCITNAYYDGAAQTATSTIILMEILA